MKRKHLNFEALPAPDGRPISEFLRPRDREASVDCIDPIAHIALWIVSSAAIVMLLAIFAVAASGR